MNEAAIRKDLQELNAELVDRRVSGPADRTPGLSDTAPQETITDCVSQIRLKLKYLLFDLEATRRENRYLRQMLEIHRRRGQRNQPGFDSSGEEDFGS